MADKLYIIDHDALVDSCGVMPRVDQKALQAFLRQHPTSFIITTFDYASLVASIGRDACRLATGCITGSGTAVYLDGKEVTRQPWEISDLHASWLHKQLEGISYTLRFGRHLEKKIGCCFFSIPGFEAPPAEQERFNTIDRRSKIRQTICDQFNERFSNAIAQPFRHCEILITPRTSALAERIKILTTAKKSATLVTTKRSSNLLRVASEEFGTTDVKLNVQREESPSQTARWLKSTLQADKLFS